MMADVYLKKGEGRSLKAGGAWVYDNEIGKIDGSFENGEIVRVLDFDGFDMGKGFINTNSVISVRMLSRRQDAVIDEAFISMRVKAAWEYRKTVMPEQDLNACRIIFGEADWLPGLVVDKYNDVLVTEALALGLETDGIKDGLGLNLKQRVIKELLELLERDGFKIRLVYERSDAPVRKKEGLPLHKGILWSREDGFKKPAESVMNEKDLSASVRNDLKGKTGSDEIAPVEIVENGVHYMIDVVNGQKTGFFLDQKYNRLAMQRICRGKRVLDCFTHMGTFALNAGLAGATEVTGLDISEFAVGQATANAKLNGLENTVKFKCANVLDELPKLYEAGEKYDVVILDPPAFTKSREATKNAIKGYREINMKGLKLVRDGGYLASCSCSHFMTQELLFQTISQAAKSVHKRLRQVEFRTQSCDHPILWSADESYYLKFYIFQICEEK